MALRYHLESRGYTVMDGDRFIGRVARSRSTYHHSNGRRYRSWSWSAFPPTKPGSFQHRTRASASAWLVRVLQQTARET